MSSKHIQIDDLKVGVDDIESLHVKLRVKSEEFNVQKKLLGNIKTKLNKLENDEDNRNDIDEYRAELDLLMDEREKLDVVIMGLKRNMNEILFEIATVQKSLVEKLRIKKSLTLKAIKQGNKLKTRKEQDLEDETKKLKVITIELNEKTKELEKLINDANGPPDGFFTRLSKGLASMFKKIQDMILSVQDDS